MRWPIETKQSCYNLKVDMIFVPIMVLIIMIISCIVILYYRMYGYDFDDYHQHFINIVIIVSWRRWCRFIIYIDGD